MQIELPTFHTAWANRCREQVQQIFDNSIG
jgi:hypothetical protein